MEGVAQVTDDGDAVAGTEAEAEVAAEIDGLRVEIGGRAIVDGVSLRARAGAVTALVGASGSGKTTTGLALLGEYPAGAVVAGDVRIAGGGLVGYVPQHPAAVLNPARRVGALLHDIARAQVRAEAGRGRWRQRRAEARARVLRALEAAQLPDGADVTRRYPHQLSGGQQQRVVLAQALLLGARVVVADEPTTGQDALTKRRVVTELAAVARRGIAVLLLSHDLDVVRELADEVVVMREGRVVERGTARRVLAGPRDPWTRQLLAADAKFGAPCPVVADTDMDMEPVAEAAVPEPGPGTVPDARGSRDPWTRQLLAADAKFGAPRPVVADTDMEPAAEAAVPEPEPGTVPDARGSRDPWTRQLLAADAKFGAPCPAVGDTDMDMEPVAEAAVPEPGAESEPVPDARGLRVRVDVARYRDRAGDRGTVRALRAAELAVEPGECLAVVGRSGSGKTTLGRCVSGLHRDWDGEVTLDGAPLPRGLRARTRAELAAVQYVFQDARAAFDEHRDVLSQVARTAVRLRGTDAREALREARAVLSRVGLDESLAARRPGGLSGGELQRAALARALAARPRVLVCDEITSGLDTVTRAAVLDLLVGLLAEREQEGEREHGRPEPEPEPEPEPDPQSQPREGRGGMSLVLITHDLDTAALADRVAVLDAGEIVEQGPATRVLTAPRHPFTASLVAAAHGVDVPPRDVPRPASPGAVSATGAGSSQDRDRAIRL
ncbi:ABC transporter ATP-binding protein [Streptomyces daliensis]